MGKRKYEDSNNIEDLFDDPEADDHEFLDELDDLVGDMVEIESEDAGLDFEPYDEDDSSNGEKD